MVEMTRRQMNCAAKDAAVSWDEAVPRREWRVDADLMEAGSGSSLTMLKDETSLANSPESPAPPPAAPPAADELDKRAEV